MKDAAPKLQRSSVVPRIAQERDLPAILQIARQTPWEKTEYLRRQVHGGNVVVTDEDEPLRGFIVWNREFFSLPFIWLVAVGQPYRSSGIASALFMWVEAECSGSRLYTSTNRSHSAMQRFLERRGYRESGTVDVDPGDPEVFYRIDL